MTVTTRPVEDAADRKVFVDLAFALNRDDPNWVPPLKTEVHGLLDPRTNPWFEHAEARLFLAERDGQPVGRISAQVDRLVLGHMGAGTGQWGLFEAADAEVAGELIHRAEAWLRGRDMTRAMGPFSLSIWDEPGLLIKGHDHPPMVMMGHNKAEYEGWIEAAGYTKAKDLYTYDLDVTAPFPPIVLEDMILVAEYDGEPVAFMMALPDINQFIRDLDGSLFPFGWAKLLWRLRRMRPEGGRVPLMGVVKRLHATRLASQLAFMMIEYIRRAGTGRYGISRAEVGWVLEDNGPMISIAQAIESGINRVYRIYEKPL